MIDLHVHSSISDGSDTPTEIVRKAKKIGITTMALTDHDNIDGLLEAREEAITQGIDLINGIEFSVTYEGNRLIHILGLNIDIDNEAFVKGYNAYRQQRHDATKNVGKVLKAQGFEFEDADIEKYKVGKWLDRQAYAKWLVATGVVESVAGAWINYLDQIPYEEGELIEVDEAIRLIKVAGGKSFIAHFNKWIGLDGFTDVDKLKRLEVLKEKGLDGIERYYPSFTEKDNKEVDTYIKKLGFIASGGTDYHGAYRPGIELGIGSGNFKVPKEILEFIV